jgi:hypothetical protein
MGHPRHPLLPHGAWMPFSTHQASTPCQPTGDGTCSSWAARAPGTGQRHLVWSSLAVSARRVEEVASRLGSRLGVAGLNGLWEAESEHASRMEGLTPGGVMDAESARYRVELESRWCADPVDGPWDLVKPGHHRPRIARMAWRYEGGKEKTSRRCCGEAGRAAALPGARALACDTGGNRGVVGMDQLTGRELVAVGKAGGGLADVLLVVHGRGQRQGETLALGRTQGKRLVEALFGLEATPGAGSPQCQAWVCGVPDPLHADAPLASPAAAETPHDLFACLRQASRLALERGGAGAALLGEVGDELEGGFGALYRGVAAVTRWLPWARGKVSMTRGAGLTRPSSIAAAAWMAIRASIRASSIRLRNAQSVSGNPTWACEGLTCYARRPQAYMSAKAVRKRGPLSSSEAPRACLSNSRAHKTRSGTGRRPRWDVVGHRVAKLCAMALTRAAQGKGAAHWRLGGVSGTTSVTCRGVPVPLNPC